MVLEGEEDITLFLIDIYFVRIDLCHNDIKISRKSENLYLTYSLYGVLIIKIYEMKGERKCLRM